MAKDGISFAGTPDLIEWLEGRAARSMTSNSAGMRAKAELGLWRSVLRVELQRQHWTLAETYTTVSSSPTALGSVRG